MTQNYEKMNGKSKLITEVRPDTHYEKVAREFGVTPRYVGKINRGETSPKRGTGLLIKQRLAELSDAK